MNQCRARLIQAIPFKTLVNVLALFPLVLLGASAHATISLRSDNATYMSDSGSRTTFAWPINNAAGCTYAPSVYPANLALLDVSTNNLNFVISTSHSSTATRYIQAEWTDNGNELLKLNDSNVFDAEYPANTSTVSFQINLDDFCLKAQARSSKGGGTCAFTAHAKDTWTIRIGITTHRGEPLINYSSENDSATHDYEDFTFHIVRCSTLTQSYSGGLETYALRANPGDGRAKILVGTSPSTNTSDFALQSTLFLLQASTTSLTTPLTIAQATVATRVSGTGSGEYTIDNLVNDTTYNVQMAYINEGGFITVPGPPNGATAAPTVTPSGIAGLLDRNTCFIATAAYGDEWDTRLEILRQFRGQVLRNFVWGRGFINWYYTWSPSAADWLTQHPQYRTLIKLVLFPAVEMAAVILWMREHLWVFSALVFISIMAVAYFMHNSRRRRRGIISLTFFIVGSYLCVGSVTKVNAAERLTEQDLGDTQKVQPYIESLKKKQGDADTIIPTRPKVTDDGSLQPYINHLEKNDKGKTSSTIREGQPYMDSLLEKYPSTSPSNKDGHSHIEALKSGLQLKPKMVGTVKNAISITAPVAGTFEVSGGSAQANSFESVYRTQNKYNPGVDIYLEHHLIRDRIVGAFGPFFRAGAFFQRGTGRFTKVNAESDVKFSFTAFPIGVGLGYRAIQPRFVVPFVQGGIVGIPFIESRDDDKPSHRGLSTAITLNYGLNLSLDWMGRKGAWDRYDEFGIFHTYLVIQQMHMKTFQGVVDFRYHTTMAGLAFEY